MNASDTEFELLREFLLRETGIDVPESKRYLFSTRLSELLEKENCRNYSELLLRIQANEQPLVRATIEAMTTHESGFFREPHHFQTLFETLVPALLERKAERLGRMSPGLRILSAGCSFGQEAYTLAICAERWRALRSDIPAVDISIVGIDISERALERARLGSYTDLELGSHLALEDRDRHFKRTGEYWQLSQTIRDRVSFQCANLSQPMSIPGNFDVIFCRNVIIYFSRELKISVLERLRSALEPNGVLFIGSAESLYGVGVDFTHQTCGHSAYYEHPTTKANPQEVYPWKS
jgi:chemotaxis protein methyltransferase CheR